MCHGLFQLILETCSTILSSCYHKSDWLASFRDRGLAFLSGLFAISRAADGPIDCTPTKTLGKMSNVFCEFSKSMV